MGKLYIPTADKFLGPWLINQKALEELDPILLFANEQLKKSWDSDVLDNAEKTVKIYPTRKIDEIIADENQYLQGKNTDIQVQLISKDNKILSGNSIESILKDQHSRDLNPIKLFISITKNNENTFQLEITQSGDGYLSYYVVAFDDNIRNEINYRIEKWIDTHKPKTLSKIGAKISPFICIVLFFVALFFGILSFATQKDTTADFKKQAKELIDKGINKDNEIVAIDLLLKIQSDYSKPVDPSKKEINSNSLRIFLSSIVLFLLFVIQPGVIIGIGKAKNTLKFYEWWIYVQYTLIPTVFIGPFIYDKLKMFF